MYIIIRAQVFWTETLNLHCMTIAYMILVCIHFYVTMEAYAYI